MDLTLVIGNKNLSSWSLRPWLALKVAGARFKEIKLFFESPDFDERILNYSQSGMVPVLLQDSLTIGESIAICEYVAELFPKAKLWPEEPKARALARAVCAEMHSGFTEIRKTLPMRCAESVKGPLLTPDVQEEIKRVTTIWRSCREKYGQSGDMLFGHFTIADAMFAPMVTRFKTYGLHVDDLSVQSYMKAVCELPEMLEWVSAAREELKFRSV